MSVTALHRHDRPEDAHAHLSERLAEGDVVGVVVYTVHRAAGESEARIRGTLCGDVTDAEMAMLSLLMQRWALPSDEGGAA